MSKQDNNWHRWGEEDELGAANIIGASNILSALDIPSQGRALSLALPVRQRNIPVFGGRTPMVHSMRWDGGDYLAREMAPDAAKSSDDYIFMGCHSGTHIDGLAHAWEGSQLYNGYSESSVRSTGAHKLGIENLSCLISRGILLDALGLVGDDMRPGFGITPEHVEGMLNRQDVELRPGDVVFVRTGWLEAWLDRPEERETLMGKQQGLTKATADTWFAADVVGIGADNFAVEVWPDADGDMIPFHRKTIRDFGMYLMELVVLDELAEELSDAGRSDFLFVAAPLPIKGGTGSPINPIAII